MIVTANASTNYAQTPPLWSLSAGSFTVQYTMDDASVFTATVTAAQIKAMAIAENPALVNGSYLQDYFTSVTPTPPTPGAGRSVVSTLLTLNETFVASGIGAPTTLDVYFPEPNAPDLYILTGFDLLQAPGTTATSVITADAQAGLGRFTLRLGGRVSEPLVWTLTPPAGYAWLIRQGLVTCDHSYYGPVVFDPAVDAYRVQFTLVDGSIISTPRCNRVDGMPLRIPELERIGYFHQHVAKIDGFAASSIDSPLRLVGTFWTAEITL